jgi:hypothetical protein
VQRAAAPYDPRTFGERTLRLGHHCDDEMQHRAVERFVGERQRLAVALRPRNVEIA